MPKRTAAPRTTITPTPIDSCPITTRPSCSCRSPLLPPFPPKIHPTSGLSAKQVRQCLPHDPPLRRKLTSVDAASNFVRPPRERQSCKPEPDSTGLRWLHTGQGYMSGLLSVAFLPDGAKAHGAHRFPRLKQASGIARALTTETGRQLACRTVASRSSHFTMWPSPNWQSTMKTVDSGA